MAILEIKKLTRNFKGLMALCEIDIEVIEGEILGIIGPNGAGKTTLFNIISGFLKPSSGEVLFRGENIVGLKPFDIVKKGIVRSFQGASLFQAASCLENMIIAHHLYKKFGFWQAIIKTKTYTLREEEVVRNSLKMLEGFDLADKKEVRAHDIPYGHQKMIGLGMALATNAELLLLDEPVSGMNPEEAVAMTKIIERIRSEQGKTVVVVEHNMKVVMKLCDRIVVLNHGEKIAEGLPEAIRSNWEVTEAYLGVEET
ncbi:MAG: ABC transporter ATP-binding protein [Thermodesulfobacteriota bacterium]|jgi:branched-chain amino acid transport system ATP-binding protein